MFLLTIITLKVIYSRYTNWLTHTHTRTHTHIILLYPYLGKTEFHYLEISRKLSRYLGKTKFHYLEISRKLSWSLRKTEEIISLSRENGGNKMYECMAV